MAVHKNLSDQVVVITGASSGIGLCTALLAADKGAKLVLASRSENILAELASDFSAFGIDAKIVVADVGIKSEVERIAQVAMQAYGRIDTWINNAGATIYGRLDIVPERYSRRLFDTNFWGVVHGSLAALPFLKISKGALINIGSEVSDAVVPLQGMYSSSKHAVKGFTDALRVETEEVDGSEMTITLIQPTAVNTPIPEHALNYMDREPKLPDPMIDPHRVAEAILTAAENGGRNISVGTLAAVDKLMWKMMPRMADKFAAKRISQQQKNEKPVNPSGCLYHPSESGRIYGNTNSFITKRPSE